MKPTDLLDLANDLCEDDREAAWRASASRAYYAAFHAARTLFTQAGFIVPDADRAHAYLWMRLQNCGHPDLQVAGLDLSELRKERNIADYDIEVSWPHRRSLRQVTLAFRTLDLFELALDSPETLARITAAVRDYERDVLKDVTWRGTSP